LANKGNQEAMVGPDLRVILVWTELQEKLDPRERLDHRVLWAKEEALVFQENQV